MKDADLWVSLDDLTFEHRNKQYGAYALRKEYPQHLTWSMLAVFAFLLLLIPLAEQIQKRAAEAFTALSDTDKPLDGDVIYQSDFEVIKPEPKPPVTNQPASSAEPGTRIIPVIDTRPETGPTQPFTGSVAGGGETGTTPTTAGTGTGNSDTAGTGTATLPAESGDYVHDYVEHRPQYPGGDAALYKFLSQNVRYPSAEAAAGLQGKVFVSFVCDKNGNVSNVKIEKGVSAGLDEEAVRVIKLLKGFSPALQAGRPVNYRYILPVNFRLK